MARYTTSISTPRSPSDAFAYMSDLRHFPEWDPGTLSAVRVLGDGGVGTAYELMVKAGTTSMMRYEVLEYDAPRRVLLVAHTSLVTSVDEIRVAPSGTGSVVTYAAELKLNGRLSILDPLLGLAFKRIGDRAVPGLERVLAGTVVRR